MSCCCNSLYTGIPCCCPPYTTTTTTFPICEDGEICNKVYTTDCVIYTGDSISLPCLTIEKGDRYTDILEVIMVNLENCEPFGTTTTTTQGPQVLVPICLTYATEGGCAASCVLECSTYYVYTDCYSYIQLPDPINILNHCIIYIDSAGLNTAPSGFYSYPTRTICLIVNTIGEVTGVTNCSFPPAPATTTTQRPQKILNPTCCTNTYSITLPGTSFVANGVTVSVSSTTPTRTGVGNGSFNYAACLPPWNPTTIYMGAPGFNMGYTTADFTLTFSQPVNDVKIKLVNYSASYTTSPYVHPSHPYPHLETQEEFTFTVNNGTATIVPCDYCYAEISGNKIKALIDIPNGIDISNGSAVVKIVSNVPYTSLKINGAILGFNCINESLGTFFEMCDFTIV